MLLGQVVPEILRKNYRGHNAPSPILNRVNRVSPTKVEMKLLVSYSDEGYNPCSLRRGPFLPKLTVKEIYKTLILPLVKQPTAEKSIESVLQRNDIKWATVYLLPQKTTIESRMRISQYKILNNILYLNNRLHKFGYVEYPLCSLCNSETETMTHPFWPLQQDSLIVELIMQLL